MKEYIFQPTIAQDGNAIVIVDAPTGLIKNNILAIINKSTKGIIHSPLIDGIANLAYSGTTLTINLNAGHHAIAGDLLIKAYTDEEGGGGGGIEIMTDAEYAPALSDLNDMLDEIDESESASE